MSQTKEMNLTFNSESKLLVQDSIPRMFLSVPTLPNIEKENQPSKFFKGKVKNVFLFRDLLLFLSEIVNSRFYRADLWRYLDPVITCEDTGIRMECFSSCASIYGRVDINTDMFEDYEVEYRGTTNVNFNKDFIAGLAMLRSNSDSFLEVGKDSVTLESNNKKVKEEKVKLPDRWIKGFLQSQSIYRKAEKIFELNTMAAKKFISECQMSMGDKEHYLVKNNSNVMILNSKPPKSEYIPVSGLNRLTLLKKLMPHITGLNIYFVKETGSTLWLVKTKNASISFATSSSVKNGFSGEGESLRSLTLNRDESLDDFAMQMIQSLHSFSITELALTMEITEEEVLPIVDSLSMNGILGFDCETNKYFYRVLPFADKKNSRFENSKEILKKSRVEIEKIEKTEGGMIAKGWVEGTTATYYSEVFVNKQGYIETAKCNCNWFIKNELKRGPCKHILALRLYSEFL
jgi:hypothetical protein